MKVSINFFLKSLYHCIHIALHFQNQGVSSTKMTLKRKLKDIKLESMNNEENQISIEKTMKIIIRNNYDEDHLLLESVYNLDGKKIITIGLSPRQNFTPVVKLTTLKCPRKGITFDERAWKQFYELQPEIRKYLDEDEEEHSKFDYMDLTYYGIHFGGNLGDKNIMITWSNLYCYELSKLQCEKIFNMNEILKQRFSILNKINFYSFYQNVLANIVNDLKKINDTIYTKKQTVDLINNYMNDEEKLRLFDQDDKGILFKKIAVYEMVNVFDEIKIFEDIEIMWNEPVWFLNLYN